MNDFDYRDLLDDCQDCLEEDKPRFPTALVLTVFIGLGLLMAVGEYLSVH